MKYVNYVLLVLFWIGLLLLAINNKQQGKDYRFAEPEIDKIRNYLLKHFNNLKKTIQRKEMKKELADALSYIKNITILGNGKSVSSDILLSDLSDFTDSLKPAFLSMARFIQMNDKESASKVLGETVGTSIAKDIGIFLAGWEDIEPNEILENIETYQSMLRNETLTEQRAKDEMISDIIYFPVIINCMAVLLNFVYISYYVQQQELFNMFFL